MDKYEKQIKNNKNANLNNVLNEVLDELNELKQLALSCVDKNGNPNITAAIRIVESKAKLLGLYSAKENVINNTYTMNEITVDGIQLKLNIGEEFFKQAK